MLKILQTRLQQYVSQELPDIQARFRKGRGTRSNCQHSLNYWKSKIYPEKYLFLLYWLCQSLSQCGSQQTEENSSRVGISDQLTCLLRHLYAGQEGTVRTEHGTMDWFRIGKGVHQGWILSSCLFDLYAEYIMRNTGLDKAQAGIKIARRNIQ